MNAAVLQPARLEGAESQQRLTDMFAGVLIGTALGDALGLPMEGLTQHRQQRLFPQPLRHRLLAGRGMLSDDTEHTLMVAQALLAYPDDARAFQRCVAWKLRWWLLALPAGVGFATLRAVLKLWLGISPETSGVFSAGNGPAMRSAILGVFFAEQSDKRRAFVSAATRLTHTDPRAEVAALAVAEAAAWVVSGSNDVGGLFTSLEDVSANAEWQALLQRMRSAFDEKLTTQEFAAVLGLTRGVTGYAFHTVPVALYSMLLHLDDFRAALSDAIACGGDTDTVGAITGALVGARVGVAGIPEEWRNGILEWPRSVSLLEAVAERLGRQQHSPTALGAVRYFWPAVPLRNLLFLAVVLCHGFRRLLPPY